MHGLTAAHAVHVLVIPFPGTESQGWLGRSDTPLYEGSGVQLVRWSDALVAWGSDKAITVRVRLMGCPPKARSPSQSLGFARLSHLSHSQVYDTNQHVQIRTITRYKPTAKKAAAASSAPSPPPPPAPSPPPGRVSLLLGQNNRIYMSWPDYSGCPT